MEFEWDAHKDAANRKKHGLSFDEAKEIFSGPVLTWTDMRRDYGEPRQISIGESSGAVFIVVAHTPREGRIRIISARKANQKERRITMSVSKKRLEELKAIPEEDIDTSDIPELEQEFWENAELVHPQHLNEAMLKARLATHIASIIRHRGLTQQEAADVLGVEQPRVSALMRGNLYRFSAARLFDFLNALDRDIEIVIRRKPKKRSRAHTVVVSPPTSRKAS